MLIKNPHFDITIEEIEYIGSRRYFFGDEKFNYNFMLDHYQEYKEDFDITFKNASEVLNREAKLLYDFYIDYELAIKKIILEGRTTLGQEKGDMYPVIFYVSASKDPNTIGLMIDKNAEVALFEGNDESAEETYVKINSLLDKNKETKIWGSHSQKVIGHIEDTGTLPEGLYVSPERSYAAGYWGEDRILFSGIVFDRDFRKESDVDWKAIGTPIIKNLRVF